MLLLLLLLELMWMLTLRTAFCSSLSDQLAAAAAAVSHVCLQAQGAADCRQAGCQVEPALLHLQGQRGSGKHRQQDGNGGGALLTAQRVSHCYVPFRIDSLLLVAY
jgi:hypothetical protein